MAVKFFCADRFRMITLRFEVRTTDGRLKGFRDNEVSCVASVVIVYYASGAFATAG